MAMNVRRQNDGDERERPSTAAYALETLTARSQVIAGDLRRKYEPAEAS